jgi:hypothetical protein
MTAVIIGDGAPAVLNELSATLRERTLALARELDGPIYEAYTPWLCARPVIEERIPTELTHAPYLRGDVVTDARYLHATAGFLNAHPDLILAHLIGSRSDWDLCTDTSTRPRLTSALQKACADIRNTSPFMDAVFDSVVEVVVPLKQQRARGLSSQFARGAIFLGLSDGYCPMNLALDIVHEMGHQALALLQSSDPLFVSDPRAPVYSEVRHALRPAAQSLHAAGAIAFMTRFVSDSNARSHIHPDFYVPMSEALLRAVRALRAHCEFTAVGNQILSDFEAVALE